MPFAFLPPLSPNVTRAAESAYGSGHPYLKIGDQLDTLLGGLELPDPLSRDLMLAKNFWMYSLASILQYWENLTDQQMSTATRTRLDLKYALHLPLAFPGLDACSLCLFRQRLLLNQSFKSIFQNVLSVLTGFVATEWKHSVDPDLVLFTICRYTQYEMIWEATSNAIEALAASQPEWLRSMTLPHWYKRYGKTMPGSHDQLTADMLHLLFISLGTDGQYLLNAVEKSGLSHLAQMPEIQLLSRKWHHHFEQGDYQPRLRSVSCSSCYTV